MLSPKRVLWFLRFGGRVGLDAAHPRCRADEKNQEERQNPSRQTVGADDPLDFLH
jgi:hypothetical protein